MTLLLDTVICIVCQASNELLIVMLELASSVVVGREYAFGSVSCNL